MRPRIVPPPNIRPPRRIRVGWWFVAITAGLAIYALIASGIWRWVTG